MLTLFKISSVSTQDQCVNSEGSRVSPDSGAVTSILHKIQFGSNVHVLLSV